MTGAGYRGGGEVRAGLPPPPARRWVLADPPPPDPVRDLAAALSLPAPVCALLVQRGFGDPEGARGFLRPLLSALHPPSGLTDLDRAVDRVWTAIRGGETILVHGDYDVDGIASTALLTRWLRRLGGQVHPFLPDRIRDGYDFGPAGITRAREVGATLIVTVDTGITAVEAVRSARAAGIDVVVTDHHLPGDELPPAVAVVNPNRPDCPYPWKGLAGAGVAFKLCQGLAERAGIPFEELLPLLDLVAFATVADVAPLAGENRILVGYGLRAMEQTARPGIRGLLQAAGVEGRPAASDISFRMAPRINAAGRIGDPQVALALLLSDDAAETASALDRLEEWNGARRGEEARALEEALSLLPGAFDPERDPAAVVAGEGWHPGVVGLVATRLVERLHRPVLVLSFDGDRARGSGRSIPGFHLRDALGACAPLLERFGGHAQAAGLELHRDHLEDFRGRFVAEARTRLPEGPPPPELRIDLDLALGDATPELTHRLTSIGPFGQGNPLPVFRARGVRVERPKLLKGEHWKGVLRDDRGAALEMIGFRMAERVDARWFDGTVDVVFELESSTWRGVSRVQARLLDLRPGEGEGVGVGWGVGAGGGGGVPAARGMRGSGAGDRM